MGNVDEGITKPEIAEEFRGCSVYARKAAEPALPDSTAVVAVWRILTSSTIRSMILTK